ncbi:quinol:cytochrome c oxidoreductase quinone-binding subunit 1 [Winogradskyella eximia]|jgi:predicted flap endonuclease-1-like 5' DNA nuclease/Ni/Fe-hydrogenase subunit HybB-like protein|uniref:Quinol:cytochrome c oxidoreductase quinone-binding subunit 1 n=1 Tax=Winogradskyella eximia TaxID=262006 RepID=A0A3D9H4D1_9FLAO|nr:NrfD/PsrC family molybdoenzyme membrane anchor subunit [Winogradskyella eximia]RED44365.1 quinol:cytochrome c oxidoreductase quinone-binding subunit 1 [Winogradskyella eximia]
MASHYEAPIRRPLVTGEKSYHDVTVDVARPVEGKANRAWWIVFSIALVAFLWGIGCIIYTVSTGIGVWGLNKTVNWAWDITNFVWWVGIGHAGTLISAVLLLFRQKWRMAINRSAEAMTIFSVVQAGLFPIIHMGRPWLAYWVLPIPNQFGSLWVNFNSPLLWDVFAISTYLSVSLVFWWTGLLPDFAMLRDRAVRPFQKKIYSLVSFGWSGRAKDWQRFEEVSLVLAGLATPLVLSVHTIVSFDFATSVIPGWHTTIFPPYFVAGAVFSGFAMVNTLLIIMRKVCNLEDYITVQHIELMNIVIMITGSIVGVAYITELFIAWYSGVEYEQYAFLNRATGPYWWAYWAMMSCNVFSPQFMWFKKLRTSIMFSFFISIVVNIGMWFERFVIIVTSLHRDYLPSSWSMFSPTFVDIGIFIGTIGFFFVLFLLYSRTFPVIAQAEVKTILKSSGERYKNIRERGESLVGTGADARTSNLGATAVTPTKPIIEKTPSVDNTTKVTDLLGTIGAFDAATETADDLKKVNGIGPKMEEVLNSIGIYTFLQVSKMTKKEYDLLDSITGSFPGRAERDDWSGQAKNLLNN